MAGNIKGITIQIGADTTKLSSALNSANRAIKNTESSLKSVERALKLNPTNINLLRDKQGLLNDKIADTKTKLDAMKQAQAQLDAQGIDKTSREYRELQTNIDTCEAELKGLNKEAKSFGSAGAQAIAAVGEKMKDLGAKISAVGQELTTKVTLPLAAVGTVAVTKFAEVDKTMQLTNATMGNTAEQADLLNQAMKDAAANSTFGMNDAATATLNFARAGLTAEQAAAALAPAMNLAAGEGGNLDTVSAGLVATINGFGGSFDDAAAYADVFANACNNSALDIDSLSEAMSIAAPIFKTAGYSVNDAALYMGVMANAGIDANTAANALKTGMARLVKPAKEGQEWMDKLGISVTNADGSMKDSITIQRELNAAFSGLSESEQIAAASAIFGKNQMSNWLALINTAPGEVSELSEALAVEGTTAEMSQAMMSGFGGSIEKLKSSIDVAATSLGQALAPTISKVADAIQRAVDWFNSLSDEQREMIAKIGLVVAAIGPLLLVVGKVISLAGTIMTLAPAIGTAITVMTGPIGLVVAAIAAVIAIGVALYKNWDKIKAKAQEIGGAIKEKFENMKKAVSEKMTAMKNAVAEKFNAIKEKVLSTPIGQAMAKVWDAARTTMGNSLSAIKAAYDKHGGGLKGAASATMEAMKQYYTAGFNFINNLTGGKLGEAVDKAKEKIGQMKEAFANSNLGVTVGAVWDVVKKTTTDALGNIKSAYDEHGGGLKGAVAATMEAVKQKFTLGWNFADNFTGGKLSEIKDKVTEKMTAVKDQVSQKLENVKAFFVEKLGPAAQTAATKFNEISNTVRTKMTEAKDKVSQALESVKTFFAEKLAAAFNTVQTKFNEIKNNISTRMTETKDKISSVLESIKSFFTSKLGSILSTVTEKMQAIKSAFTSKIQEAHDAISGIIQKIKDLFNIDLKLNIKLPHISVSGGEAPYGIGGAGKLPSFSVEWYDKGGIFDHPSIIGVGEKRPEFVGALDDLREIVREESGAGLSVQLLGQMVNLLSELVDRDATPITVNQTINARETSYAEQQKAAAYEFKQIARALT